MVNQRLTGFLIIVGVIAGVLQTWFREKRVVGPAEIGSQCKELHEDVQIIKQLAEAFDE